MYNKTPASWGKHLDFIFIDLLCLHVAFVLAYIIRHGGICPYFEPEYRGILVALSMFSILISVFFYSFQNVLRRGYYQEFAATVKHVCLVVFFSTFYIFLVQEGERYSRLTMVYFGGLYVLFSYIARVAWKKILKKFRLMGKDRSLLVITNRTIAEEVLLNLDSSGYSPFRVSGIVLMDMPYTEDQKIGGIEVVADASTAEDYICRQWVDEALICLSSSEPYPEELINHLSEMGVVVHLRMAKVTDMPGQKKIVEQIGKYTVLTSSINFATPKQVLIKRSMDIAGGLVGCLITGILFLFLAPAIYLSSPGPIFFSQTRVGKGGKRFKIYKFRSMYMDAEERKAELMAKNRVKDGMMFKLDYDPRIIGCRQLPDGTIKKGLGNYIRDLSLDEFPQFFNVLKGDMSLVGTRPPTVDEWNRYDLHHRARLAIKPGLTGMWQVSGRSNITDFEEVVKLDKKYISEWSMGLDFRILFKTVLVVLGKEGAL